MGTESLQGPEGSESPQVTSLADTATRPTAPELPKEANPESPASEMDNLDTFLMDFLLCPTRVETTGNRSDTKLILNDPDKRRPILSKPTAPKWRGYWRQRTEPPKPRCTPPELSNLQCKVTAQGKAIRDAKDLLEDLTRMLQSRESNTQRLYSI